MDNVSIGFHLQCYAKYSSSSQMCALFVAFDKFPESVKRVSIEMDIRCDKAKRFKHLLKPQVLRNTDREVNRVAGFQAFSFNELERNDKIKWRIAVKLINAKQYDGRELLRRRVAQSM